MPRSPPTSTKIPWTLLTFGSLPRPIRIHHRRRCAPADNIAEPRVLPSSPGRAPTHQVLRSSPLARRRPVRPPGGDRPARPRAWVRRARPRAWVRQARPRGRGRQARRPAQDRPSRQDLARLQDFLSRNSPPVNALPSNMPESMSRDRTGPVLQGSELWRRRVGYASLRLAQLIGQPCGTRCNRCPCLSAPGCPQGPTTDVDAPIRRSPNAPLPNSSETRDGRYIISIYSET